MSFKGKRHKWIETSDIKRTFKNNFLSAWKCVHCGVYQKWYYTQHIEYSFSLEGPWERKKGFICDNRLNDKKE